MKLISTKKRAYLYIRSISLTSSPRPRDGRECSIRMVKFSIICIQEEGCEGFLEEKKKKKKRKSIIWPFRTQLFSFFVKHDFFGNPFEVETILKPFWDPFDPVFWGRILSGGAGLSHSGSLNHLSLCNLGSLCCFLAFSLLTYKMVEF